MHDIKFLNIAKKVGVIMSKEYLEKGDYYPKEAWGCEGQIYPSLMGFTLLELYKVDNNQLYLNAVKSIIENNVKKQMKSGGWSLSLASTCNGIKFEVSQDLIEITSKCEDLPPTATALRLMSEYYLLTGDKTYYESLVKGSHFLLTFWNEKENLFDEMLTGEALKLRASSKNYQIYAYQCIVSLSMIFSNVKQKIKPLYQNIKNIFEEMDDNTYPLLHAMYATLIMQKEGQSDYVKTIVKRKIFNEITIGSKFIIPNAPGAMGHRDGLRGICLDEGHLRNSVGAALAMNYYDTFVEKNTFTNSLFYSDLEKWIIQMNKDGLFYEFIDFKKNKLQGLGTPGQYVPLMWILNKI